MFQSQAARVKTEFWSLNQDKISKLFFYLLLLFLPTQFGRHFWPSSSFIQGLRLDYLSPTIYFTDLIIVLIFVFSFKKLIKFFKKISLQTKILISAFFVSLTLGVINSNNPQAGWYGLIKVIEYFFLAAYVCINLKTLKKEIIFMLFLSGIIFESFLAIAQYINAGSINGVFYFLGERTFNSETPGIANASINGELILRPYATFSHPNILAGYLVIAMLFLLLFFQKTKNQMLLLSAGIIFGTAALLLTFSRSAIFLWAIYLLVMFVFLIFKKYKKANIKSIIFILLLIVLVFSIFKNSLLGQRFFQTRLSDESVVERNELTAQAIKMFYKNPAVGIGVNNFFNNLNYPAKNKVLIIQPAHNIFLLTLAQTGITGFLFLIFLFYKSFLNILNYPQNKKYLLMIIFAVIFLGMFDHYFLTLQQGQILLSIIFATLLSYKN